jgi:hypothetical protein
MTTWALEALLNDEGMTKPTMTQSSTVTKLTKEIVSHKTQNPKLA